MDIFAHVISPFSRGLHFCRVRRTSYTMDEFCLHYLLLILLMRSGDVETNPGPNASESSVSEMEFLKLAQDIDPSYYYNVGISLGFSHAQLKAILIGNLMNFKDAFMDVFMKWNIKQQPPHSNKRQLLAHKLREIDLGCLSDGLLNGPPIPNSIGGLSRLLEPQTKPPSAEPQTKPLSPELVERCANDFKFKYRSTLCKIRADPLDPASIVQFKDMYTNLFLLEEHGKQKRKLDYNDILDLKVNGEFPKRIMVQGEAGAGKTTFCAKIAWDWIEGRHFSHFVWVLIVPLREFKQHTIGKIAKSYLDKNNPATVSQITEYIQSNPGKVFITFDGLDEVSGEIVKPTSCKLHSTDQMQLQPSQPSVNSPEACGSSSETGDIGLVDILCSDQLASCPVLVTTRPWRAVEIRSDGDLMKLYTFIHVEGFNRENLSVYIHKHFPNNEDKANQLIQFTSENDVISENMAHYPIYVAMLCLMWKEVAFESQDPDVAALVKDRVSSKEIVLDISRDTTAHTVAGYEFIQVGPHVRCEHGAIEAAKEASLCASGDIPQLKTGLVEKMIIDVRKEIGEVKNELKCMQKAAGSVYAAKSYSQAASSIPASDDSAIDPAQNITKNNNASAKAKVMPQSKSDHLCLMVDLVFDSNDAEEESFTYSFDKGHYDIMRGAFAQQNWEELFADRSFDKDLTFRKHIAATIQKANQMLGIIKRAFVNTHQDIFIPLYKTLVRPHLEYCTVSWNPRFMADDRKIEAVPQRATRMIPGMSSFSYR
eukprot:XP_011665320.1 PREDICTED: uncharacterized protein LOC105438782 [Strongylocentrotus purpuratus]